MPRVKPASEETKRRLAQYAPVIDGWDEDPNRPGLYIARYNPVQPRTPEWDKFVREQCTGVIERARAAKRNRK